MIVHLSSLNIKDEKEDDVDLRLKAYKEHGSETCRPFQEIMTDGPIN